MMRIGLTSWSLRACSTAEAVGLARTLGFGGLDLGYFYGPALSKAAILADPEAVAKQVRALGITVPNFYHLFGDTLADRNLADATHLQRNAEDFGKIVKFCEAAGIPSVFVLPGVCNPGQGRAQALAQSAASLATLLPIAQRAGITLTIEPHVHSFLESPTLVLDLLAKVPGLKLTLDYAHFVCMGHTQDAIDVLAPHAAHVHVRQARPGALQTKLAKGTINMEAMLATLRDAGYGGWLSVEFVHQDYMDTLYDDVLTETIACRDLLRAWLG
jgi:sugar phosphate isomerase/epimerase